MGRQKTLFEKRIIEYWHLSKYDFESEFTNSAKSRLMKKLRQNKRIYTFSFTTLYYDAEASDRHESMLDKKGNQIRPNWVDQETILSDQDFEPIMHEILKNASVIALVDELTFYVDDASYDDSIIAIRVAEN